MTISTAKERRVTVSTGLPLTQYKALLALSEQQDRSIRKLVLDALIEYYHLDRGGQPSSDASAQP